MAAATATKRFSKQTMIDELHRRLRNMEASWGFDPYDGSSQVERRDGDAKQAYGAYNAFRELLEEIQDDRL